MSDARRMRLSKLTRTFSGHTAPLIGVVAATIVSFGSAPLATAENTLVLPLQAVGVDPATTQVSQSLLVGELQSLGYEMTQPNEALSPCVDIECARLAASRYFVDRVIFGSLSQLGSKVIARVQSYSVATDSLDYNDQLNASTLEDLDMVMARVAEGIASGTGTSDHVKVGRVLASETEPLRLRKAHRGFGVRTGFVFPTGDSFGNTDRLTSFKLLYKFERERFFVETNTLLGLSWGSDAVDWPLLDIFAARFFGAEDTALYFGGGVGVHVVHVEGPDLGIADPGYPFDDNSQTATTPTLDLGGGVTFLRTYDFQLHFDVRYHIVFEDFEQVGGDGAHGLSVSIGTGR